MTAVVLAIGFCLLSAAVVFGLGRRKRRPGAGAAVVVFCGSDKKAAIGAVRAYYYEELFERTELRRRIFLVCRDDELKALLWLEEKYPLLKVISKSDMSVITRILEKGS